ncbi:MAG: hypothetical protein KatS3mg025_1874 [Bacteroidia bacterium]|nr:MAG: hypothetical protein KatS3mg025_1874 [Bacteroidia bacterium]
MGLRWRFYLWKEKLAELSGISYPPVSILIAAHNAARTLRPLLLQLEEQRYPALWEVIVAADRCTDETEALLQEMQGRLPLRYVAIKAVPTGWQPKKYALWRASALAQYAWCVCIDADVVLSLDWLRGVMGVASGHVAVIAPAWLVSGGSLGGRLAAYEAALVQVEAIGRAAWGRPYMATGRGWGVRRAWLRAGLSPWRTELSGDDDLTFQLIPPRQVSLSSAATFSPAPASFREAFHRKWRHLQTARHFSLGLRLSLACIPLLQAVGGISVVALAPMAWPALLIPPLAKGIALYLFRAPGAAVALWADWILLLLQALYPLGVYLRKARWSFP